MREIRMRLPEELAAMAEAQGLLDEAALRTLLRDEIRRRAGRELLAMAERLSATGVPPMTDDELAAEIAAARDERRVKHARRS
jgi:hypothetical protein